MPKDKKEEKKKEEKKRKKKKRRGKQRKNNERKIRIPEKRFSVLLLIVPNLEL